MEAFIRQRHPVTPDNFAEVANLILNHTLLITSTKCFRIYEIEFYLCESEQETAASEKESTSELEEESGNSDESEQELHQDLYTHNNPDQLTYGRFYFHKTSKNNYKVGTYKCCGILIRSIYDLEQNKIKDVKKRKVIEGSCNSVRAILACYDCEKQMWKGMRYGLNKTKYPAYWNRKYRYLKDKIKKSKASLEIVD